MLKRILYETIKRRDNLTKYDLVIVGNRRGANLARLFHNKSYQIYDTLLINSKSQEQVYNVFKTRTVDPKHYLDGTNISFTDGVAIKSIGDNIELVNGRRIDFEQLVIVPDYVDDFKSIDGLQEALQDVHHPVYSRTKDLSQRTNKNIKEIFSFMEGDFYFYIPKYPYNGEDLIALLRVYECLKRENVRFHVVTPNTQLYNHSESSEYQAFLESKGIILHLGSDISKVDKQNRTITLDNNQVSYDCLYFHGIPAKQSLKDDKYYEENTNLGEIARNIVMSLQGQETLSQAVKPNPIDVYLGNYRVKKILGQGGKIDKYISCGLNIYPMQVGRFVWQTYMKYYLSYFNELFDYYIVGGLLTPSGQSITKVKVQDLLQVKQVQLDYALQQKSATSSQVSSVLNQLIHTSNLTTYSKDNSVIKPVKDHENQLHQDKQTEKVTKTVSMSTQAVDINLTKVVEQQQEQKPQQAQQVQQAEEQIPLKAKLEPQKPPIKQEQWPKQDSNDSKSKKQRKRK